MFKYRSKCKWNQLIFINNKIIEIRPGEFFESTHQVQSPFIEEIKEVLVSEPKKRKVTEDVISDNSKA